MFKKVQCNMMKDIDISVFAFHYFPQRGVGRTLVVVQYQANPRPGKSKLLYHDQLPKIRVKSRLLNEQCFRFYSEKNRVY